MLAIKIICVGKLKEKFYLDASAEYTKRLSGYCKLEIRELIEERLPAQPSQSEIDSALNKEADNIIANIPKGAFVAAMCVEGREYDSPGVAKILNDAAVAGTSKLCFIIGGSFGLHQRVKNLAEVKMSMSRMTFPHHLARIMLLEQIYRGFKINEGSRYHK
jgi:23S rRNA (pseudouridine1915-N3)-methyltransferase